MRGGEGIILVAAEIDGSGLLRFVDFDFFGGKYRPRHETPASDGPGRVTAKRLRDVLLGCKRYNGDMPTLKYTFHPACLLFPQLGKEELRELADNIKARGLLHDIILYQGKILDGRNRYLACRLAGVKPRFVDWQGNGSPVEWVISENLIRRHLTSSQRAVIANDMLPLLEKEAKERQRLSLGRGEKGCKKLDTFSNNGPASHVAARITKTNSAYVQAVKAVGKQAPDLLDAIRSGHLNVPDAVKLAKVPTQERKKMLKKLQAGGITARAIVGDGDHRLDKDQYYTPTWAIDALLSKEKFKGQTWEPAEGDGRIVAALRRAGCEASGSDVATGTDFLTTFREVDNVVTNPPWGLKTEFIRHAQDCARRKVALLLPLSALSGVARRPLFQNRAFRLRSVYVFDQRLNFNSDKGSSTLTTGWFVWERGYHGEPVLRWLP